ncbi:MAG TPA: iron dependent repressor, metal binding and dimerization domain protein [Candidatus Polarisedimenticolia bacterium]
MASEASEEIDEVLEYLYLEQEGHKIPPEVCAHGALLSKTALIEHIARKGLVVRDGGGPSFTEEGQARARLLVRRHRLAEKLFTERFGMEGDRVEEEACYFEHRLSPGMTDAICAFLGHPRRCPHGHDIPTGPCCEKR